MSSTRRGRRASTRSEQRWSARLIGAFLGLLAEAAPKTPSEDPDDGGFDEVAVVAVANAWYGRMIGLPDAARARAQNAYTIASAAAAGLVVAAVLTHLDGQPVWVRTLAFAGIGAWLLTCGLYVRAIAFPPHIELPDITGTGEWLGAVADATRMERHAVNRRLRFANVAAVVAVALSAAALAGIAFHGPEERGATLGLTDAGQKYAAGICHATVTSLRGEVETSTLNSSLITFEPTNCPGATTIYVPSSEVTGIKVP